MSAPRIPRPVGPGWGRWVGRAIALGFWNTRIVGAENVPKTGPVIVAANHLGLADGPLMIGCTPRGTHILVKVELFRSPIGFLFRLTGQIPVDRRNGRPALTVALALLQRGRVVGIFPEGYRGRGDGSTARAGVAWLAVHSGAPVVPVAMLGTRRTGEGVGRIPGFRRRLHVEFGEPVTLEGLEGLPRREAVAAAQERLRAALADHVRTVAERTGLGLPTDGPEGLGASGSGGRDGTDADDADGADAAGAPSEPPVRP